MIMAALMQDEFGCAALTVGYESDLRIHDLRKVIAVALWKPRWGWCCENDSSHSCARAVLELFQARADNRQGRHGTSEAQFVRTSPGAMIKVPIEEQRKGSIEVYVVRARSLPQVLVISGKTTFNQERSYRVGALVAGRIDQAKDHTLRREGFEGAALRARSGWTPDSRCS